MAAPPNFPPFHPTTKMWTSYINRFKCVMDAANLSDIPPNRKKAYFLSFCEATVFAMATALLSATLQCRFRDHLDDMLLDQLVCGVRDDCLQKPTSTYSRQLRKHKKLNCQPYLQQRSKKQAAFPVHYEDTYFKVEYFKEEETGNCLKALQLMQRQSLPTDKRQLTPQLICVSCGGNHQRATCRFRNAVCLKCQKKGHLARICQAPRNTNLPK
ncbi:hypothetical protein E2320_001764, partial [Naja naja]